MYFGLLGGTPTPPAPPPPPAPPVCNRIRFYPTAGNNWRLTYGKFQGSTDNQTWTELHFVNYTANDGQWTDVNISNTLPFRYLRWFNDNGYSYTQINEIEFYHNATKLTGTSFASEGDGHQAFDGNTATGYSTAAANGFVGIDLGQ